MTRYSFFTYFHKYHPRNQTRLSCNKLTINQTILLTNKYKQPEQINTKKQVFQAKNTPSLPDLSYITIQRETTRREKEKERSRRIDRSGWLKSCRVFAAARRAWGVQWAMRGCVSAHVGALSTPTVQDHSTGTYPGSFRRTYTPVNYRPTVHTPKYSASRCFTYFLSRSLCYSFSTSFLSLPVVVVQHPRLASHPLSLSPSLFFRASSTALARATIVIKTRFTDYSVVISLSLSLFLISMFFLDKMNFVFLLGCPRAVSLGSVNFSTVSY